MTNKIFSEFVCRIPSLPYNKFKDLSNYNNLRILFSNREFQRAIYIASPVLYDKLLTLLVDKDLKPKKEKKIIDSLVRYLIRMSTRSTPFGLFSSCFVGKIGNESQIALRNSTNVRTRIDMSLLCSIYNRLVTLPEVLKLLKFFPNPTIYKLGKIFRYYENDNIQKGTLVLSQISFNKILQKILKQSNNGVSYQNLVNLLIEEGYEEAESNFYINNLISNQVIVDELFYPTLGSDYFDKIIQLTKNIKESDFVLALQNINSSLLDINNRGNNEVKNFQIVGELIDNLNITGNKRHFLQVDSFKNTEKACLSTKLVDEIFFVAKFLNKLRVISTPHERFTRFKALFFDRYEYREVSLMEALDPEIGIGYSTPAESSLNCDLLDGLVATHENEVIDVFEVLRGKLYRQSIDIFEIVLTDNDVKEYKEDWTSYPDTMAAFFKVVKDDDKDLTILLNGIFGDSAASMLTRFSHCDSSIHNLVNKITSFEEKKNPEMLLAEISHISEARSGNILCRPHIRGYEIISNGQSDLHLENQIPVSDIMISLENDNFILRSKKLNKRIMPKLTSAHNISQSKSVVYKFLCDFKIQNIQPSLSFSRFNRIDALSRFQPRIKYRNTILLPATWYLKTAELSDIFKKDNINEQIKELTSWRLNNKIPQITLLKHGLSDLYFDMQNPIVVDAILPILSKETDFILTEFIFDEKACLVRESDDIYLHEIILPIAKSDLDEN